MANVPKKWDRFIDGIADFSQEGSDSSYAFGRSIDVRSDPRQVTILPRTVKESGTILTDFPKWAETKQTSLDTYIYGDTGNLYKRTSAQSYSLIRSVANSHGNGEVYSKEDDFLWYSTDKYIGRYGPLSAASPTFVDDFFGSQGGTPLNTYSLDLEAGSSQYASRADTASTSITGNLAIDMQIKPESLPTVGNSMVLLSKWDESGATRSYKFDITAVSGYFGDGSDGALTISSNTTEAPIDSSCSGTVDTTSLAATNVSFAANQVIFIHQTRGTGAGTWQRNIISGYTAGTITLMSALNATYTDSGDSQAQVRVLKQYTNVTIDSAKTYTSKAWGGNVGGILGFLASGTVTVTGSINANGQAASGYTGGAGIGFRGGNASGSVYGYTGEGSIGDSIFQTTPVIEGGYHWNSANGTGGGAGGSNGDGGEGGAGGGGHSTSGSDGKIGSDGTNSVQGHGGSTSGSADLTTITFGGGGGGCSQTGAGAGGGGGGIILIFGASITVTGSVVANGGVGQNATGNCAGGGGAGGSILIKAQTATLGSGLITANGGTGGLNPSSVKYGGDGGAGRIHLDYYTSYTGTTSPTLDYAQDNSLVTNTTYTLRFYVSSTGSNSEVYSQEYTPTVGAWQQVGVSWSASTSVATFFLNATSLGTRTGALTAIHDNASTFQIGMSKNGAGAAANFYDGLMDEVRLFNVVRTEAQMISGLTNHIPVNTAGLVAYYHLNNDYVDAVAGLNTLTASGSPVFSLDVPYPSPTTRLDIDLTVPTTSQTYAVPTTISEAAADRLTFTPTKDPQKSIEFNVANIGTGTWVITIHDQFNNIMATSTVLNANMHTGDYEFTYASVWRPLTNFTNDYHAHITCASGSPTVVSGSANLLETADYTTYYQFLVEDTKWHPMYRFLNFWVTGNERYVAKYEVLYEPHKVILGAEWRIRSFALWREFLCIGCMRGSVINEFDQGRIYFWDGYSPTFNYFIDVPEGGINAMLGTKGKLFILAGSHGDLLEYQGGDSAERVKQLPKIENTSYIDIYPQAITMWKGLLRYGPSAEGNSTDLQKGGYTWGKTNLKYNDALTYDYPISTGNYGSSVNIGFLSVVQDKLLIGYRDNTSYGVDYVSTSNNCYPTARMELIVEDMDIYWKEKEALEIVANFSTLLTGQTITTSYLLDDQTNFVINPDSGESTKTRQNVSNGRNHEAQIAIDFVTTSTSPTLKSVLLVNNMLSSESRYG